VACAREDELLAALGRGYLPPELAAHASGCPACGELRLVAGTLLDERAAAVAEAPVPSAGTMWWRLRLRHRRDAQAAARRTLLVGQGATLGLALALLAWFFGGDLAMGVRQLVSAVGAGGVPLLLAFGTLLLLAPIGGWLALRGK
jgi:hypothetical protein